MALVRPRVSLVVGPIVVGGLSRVAVIVECDEPVVVQAIDVVMRGLHRERTDAVGLSASFFGLEREFFRATGRIQVGGRMQVGRHERELTFRLPEGAPSSYRGRVIDIDYRIDARVRVVGWLDARTSATVVVSGRPIRPLDDEVVFASRNEGADVRRAYFEAAITPRVIEPGGSLQGVVSLAHVDHRCRGLRARLIAVEGVHDPFAGHVETQREAARWAIPAIGGAFMPDTPVRFDLRMPTTVVPGFAVERRVSLRWVLEIVADVARASDPRVWISVDFGRVDAAGDTRPKSPIPVGSERVARLWRRFAEQSGMHFDGQRLSGVIAGWRLDVWQSDEGSKGVGLELELGCASLGIGLGFRRTWSARDREHARALAALPVPVIGTPYAVDDAAIRWFVARPGLNHERLGWAVRDVCEIAAALRGVIDALDVAAALRDWAAPLQGLATRYGGELTRASGSVHGKRGELSFRLAPSWEDEPLAFHIELELPMPMSSEMRKRWNAADPVLFGELATRIGAVTAEGTRIRCVMRSTWAPTDASADVDQLLALAELTGAPAGPYR